MSYKTYTTEAIVCGSRANNTSDKSFLLFTKDAGMVWASAKSVREERSKQRFALQDFGSIRVSLVRGKSGWRVGSAENQANYFSQAPDKLSRASVTRVVKLLRQFLHGEVAHGEIFEDARAALSLAAAGDFLENGENIFTLRLLYRLGYIASSPMIKEYLEAEDWWELPALPKTAIVSIEAAKKASHL